MIYIIGDLHVRKEQPYAYASEAILKQLESLVKEGDTVIQSGDFFHTYKPFPNEYTMATYWLSLIAKKARVVVMAGNNAHEYHYLQKSHAIQPLESIAGVELVLDFKVLEIEGFTFLFLPWVPQEVCKNAGFDSLEEYVLGVEGSDLLKGVSPDFVMYHLEDETVFMGGVNHGIDLRFLENKFPKIKRLGGHIHLQDENYIGTPYQTRADEKSQVGRYYTLKAGGTLQEKPFPSLVEHLEVDFTDDVPPSNGVTRLVLIVREAPSVDAANEKFKRAYTTISDVQLKFSESRLEVCGEELTDDSSIRELLQEYVQVNKVDKATSKYLIGLF